MPTTPGRPNNIANAAPSAYTPSTMKSLLTVMVCLAAAATTAIAQTPGKFTGRWVGIASYGHVRGLTYYVQRSLLTFDADYEGNITNGIVRDFTGEPQATFAGQLDNKGRLSTNITPLAGNNIGHLSLRLRQQTGSGSYNLQTSPAATFRGTVQCWKETKEAPPYIGGQFISGGMTNKPEFPYTYGGVEIHSIPFPTNTVWVTPPHGLIATMSNPWLASQTNLPAPPVAPPAP